MAKAPSYEGLSAQLPLTEAARRIVRALFESVLEPAERVLRGDDTRAVHDMRVAIRRLRSALATFDGCFPHKRRRRFRQAARRVGRKLGEVRDADVHLGVLRLALGRAPEAQRAGVTFAIDTLVERRAVALHEFAGVLAGFDRALLAKALGE